MSINYLLIRRIDLCDYVSHLMKLSEIFQDSVKETENIYNILRASGLLNICIVSIISYSKDSDYVCGSCGSLLSTLLCGVDNGVPNSHKHSQSPLTNHKHFKKIIFIAFYNL